MGTHSIRTSSGITLLEVLVVMLMIAIFAVFVATRTMGTDPSLIAQTEVLKAHIRYAQMRSINVDIQWGIRCQGSHYWIFQNPNPNTRQYLPGQIPGQDPYRTANEVQLDTLGISIPDFTLTFDSWGQPTPVGGLTLTLNKTGQTPQVINVTPLTGFVQ